MKRKGFFQKSVIVDFICAFGEASSDMLRTLTYKPLGREKALPLNWDPFYREVFQDARMPFDSLYRHLEKLEEEGILERKIRKGERKVYFRVKKGANIQAYIDELKPLELREREDPVSFVIHWYGFYAISNPKEREKTLNVFRELEKLRSGLKEGIETLSVALKVCKKMTRALEAMNVLLSGDENKIKKLNKLIAEFPATSSFLLECDKKAKEIPPSVDKIRRRVEKIGAYLKPFRDLARRFPDSGRILNLFYILIELDARGEFPFSNLLDSQFSRKVLKIYEEREKIWKSL